MVDNTCGNAACRMGEEEFGEGSRRVAQAMAGRIGPVCGGGIDACRTGQQHYPHNSNCEVCVRAGGRRRAHRRQRPEHMVGSIVIDLVQLNKGDSFMLVAAAPMENGKRAIVTRPVASKSADVLEAAVAAAVITGHESRAHLALRCPAARALRQRKRGCG